MSEFQKTKIPNLIGYENLSAMGTFKVIKPFVKCYERIPLFSDPSFWERYQIYNGLSVFISHLTEKVAWPLRRCSCISIRLVEMAPFCGLASSPQIYTIHIPPEWIHNRALWRVSYTNTVSCSRYYVDTFTRTGQLFIISEESSWSVNSLFFI